MENNGNQAKQSSLVAQLVRRAFGFIELVLLALGVGVFSLVYNQPSGWALVLFVVVLAKLGLWYLLRSFISDAQLGFKPRIIYFCCAAAVVAVLFACMLWPGYTVLLVGGLAGMAIGWGVFLWSRQREKEHRSARQAASYMMFFRLMLYTAGCLYLLLTIKVI